MAVETSTQEHPTMMAEPQKEHDWLQRLVGEWTYEFEAVGPGQPPEEGKGTERVRSIGGLWIVGEAQGEMGGATATALTTLGYDPARKRYVGTWVGSMMTHLWVYEGELDAAERTLTLNTEGPSMAGDGKMVRYKDVMELRSDDHRVLTSHVLGDDGNWQQFMAMSFRRKK
jgi:hypothetical protein